MGDQHDRLAIALPDPLQFHVHALARERIQRAEWLVHQQDLGVARQRTADAGALLHAARQLVRIASAEFAEPGHLPADRRSLVRRVLTTADAQRQTDVLAHAEPGQQIGGLENDADLARRSRHGLPSRVSWPSCRRCRGRPASAAACSCRTRRGRRRRRIRHRHRQVDPVRHARCRSTP